MQKTSVRNGRSGRKPRDGHAPIERLHGFTDFTEDIIALVKRPSFRADVVPLVATAILFERYANPPQARTRWSAVNLAIAERWSWSAVTWIKQQAWKRAETRARELVQAQSAATSKG